MSIEKVREYLSKFGVQDRILEFSVSSATVELAAKALRCEPCQIAKSMAFQMGAGAILIVAAGDVKIDNSKFKAEFATKAKMVQFDEVEKVIGHAAGGVCPFAINKNVKVYLDESLKRFEKVYPACGSSNSAIGLSIPELEKFSSFEKWVDVCKFI
ncbi:MAG: YbaK/EbsC family protein [Acutalibacteraceae bacterium]|nr:YbaK/EbsC family protein [Acutalibacteraceae bacterium]